MEIPCRSLNGYFKEKYGCRTQKITVSYPFTCPHGACTYCYNGSTPAANSAAASVRGQIESGIANAKKRYGSGTKFFVYYQSYSGTNAPLDELRSIYEIAFEFENIAGISVGTRPDCITPGVLGLLESFHDRGAEVWLELGLQSACDETLSRINRGHTVRDFINAAEMVKQTRIKPVAHMIAGFPWETQDDMLRTSGLISSLGFFGIKIHPLHILEGTVMAQQYRKDNFRLLSLEEYIDTLAAIIWSLPPEMVLMRFTAEADQSRLLAPAYCAHGYKDIIRRMLEDRMQTQKRK
ncbi:MAG: TIGR01212 family radical SAM protein [Spirochaetia bacterium]|nr:TIGR01212 family radical SAM protein [Spirochaetia bacterium]